MSVLFDKVDGELSWGDLPLKTAIMLFILFVVVCTFFIPEMTIFVSLVMLLFAVIAVRPVIGLLLSTFWLPLENVMILVKSPLRKEGYEMASFFPIFIAFVFLSCLFNRRLDLKAFRPSMVLFYFWAMLSLFYTTDSIHGVNEFIKLTAGVMLVMVTVSLVKDEKTLVSMLGVIPVISIMLFVLVTVSQWYNGNYKIELLDKTYLYFEIPYVKKRPSGFTSPDVAGNIMGVYAIINIALLPYASKAKRYFLIGNVFMLSIGTFLTASKAATATLLMGLSGLAFLIPNLRPYAIRISAALGVFLTMVVASVFALSQELVLATRVSHAVSNTSSSFKDRLKWWAKGFKRLPKNFYMGDGIGGFAHLIDPFPHAHSFYFSVLFDLGVIGFVTFFYILTRALFEFIRSIAISKEKNFSFILYCLFVAYAMTLIYGIIDQEYTYYVIWLFIALSFSVQNILAGREVVQRREPSPSPGILPLRSSRRPA